MARILIPDVLIHSTCAAIRSLGRAGDVCELAWSLGPLKRWQGGRYLGRVHPIAAASVDPARYVAELEALCRRRSVDVLLPMYRDAYLALCREPSRWTNLAGCLLPGRESFALADDKLRTARHCESLGIECPRFLDPADEADLEAAGRELGYPVVVKLRRGSGVAQGLRYAHSPEGLRRAWRALGGASGELMLQEFVPGYVHDACALAASGEVVQVLTQVRKLMYPIQGGVGAVNFTTHEQALERLARRLLESLDWNGPAQVEFKLDERDGRYKLIELNPKLWGTLDLSLRAGIDFPGLLRDLVLGRPVERQRSYPAGIRYAFLSRRGIHAYLQLRRHAGLRALRDPQRYVRRHYDLDPRDPIPDLLRLGATLLEWVRGRGIRSDGGIPAQWVNRLDRVLPDRLPADPAP